MFYSTLLAVAANVPNTVSWSPKVAIVMIICNILALVIGKYRIQVKNAGGALPSTEMLGGMSAGALFGSLAFGHLLGVGATLGLANIGVL